MDLAIFYSYSVQAFLVRFPQVSPELQGIVLVELDVFHDDATVPKSNVILQ